MRLSRTIAIALLTSLATRTSAAQARRALDDGAPEAQLMGYYAAVMRFTPVGLPSRDGGIEVGGALSLIPSISVEDRTVAFGGTKIEDTNTCPAFPRFNATAGSGRFAVEAGFTPPIAMCGARAMIVSFALGRRMTLGQTWEGYARLSGFGGTVDISSTCSEEAVANPLNQTCYLGSVSQDQMKPLSAALEFSAAWQGWRARRIEPYLLVGIRYERVDFDVNYVRTPQQVVTANLPALTDTSKFRTTLARVELGAGASWDLGRLRLGGELYYAPGALMTLRARAAFALRGDTRSPPAGATP